MGTQPPPPNRRHSSPHFSAHVLWPNGWMDQGATWYGVRPRPRLRCVNGDPAPTKGHSSRRPIFGRCLFWPIGWMDHAAILYRDKSRLRPHCVRWGPSSPQKGDSAPIFSACLLWPNGRPSPLLLSTCCDELLRAYTVSYCSDLAHDATVPCIN